MEGSRKLTLQNVRQLCGRFSSTWCVTWVNVMLTADDDKRRLSPAWRLRIQRGKERQPYDAHSSPPDKTRRLWMATDADASSWLWMSLTGMEHLADGINLYTRLYEKLYKISYKKLRRAMFIWFTCRTVNTPAAPSVYYASHQYFKHCALKRQMFRTPAACNYRWLLFAANSAAVVRVRKKRKNAKVWRPIARWARNLNPSIDKTHVKKKKTTCTLLRG